MTSVINHQVLLCMCNVLRVQRKGQLRSLRMRGRVAGTFLERAKWFHFIQHTLEIVFVSLYKQRDKTIATGYFIFNMFLLQIAMFYCILIFPSKVCICTCIPHPFPFHFHFCYLKSFLLSRRKSCLSFSSHLFITRQPFVSHL